MFEALKGGSEQEIQGLKCQFPPVGYLLNRLNGKLEKRKIITNSLTKAKQYWVRTPLPDDWDKRKKEELIRQDEDPDFFDPEMEKFRLQEWDRRINGVWYMNNGKPTYLTGLHYFYLNWWRIDIGYPHLRNPDLKFFYFLQYCDDDPNCLGMVEVTKRRQGKTMRSGVFAYDYPSRAKNANTGMQSKTSEDAKKNVFQKAIVMPFKHLPEFFRPVYDTAKGLTPTSELRFFETTKKGKHNKKYNAEKELESSIDWKSSEIFAYDGTKLQRYLGDEVGKTKDVDVWERHQVVRFCCELDGEIIGKMLYTTTVEEMENGGESFMRLWKCSDQEEKNDNGRTISGLYRYFMPAYETLYFDKYGFPDEDRAKTFYLNERKALEGKPRALSAYIRKNPFNIEEAFRIDGDKCLYNAMKLNEHLDELTWKENIIERGNFIWKDGNKDSKVLWVKDRQGRFRINWIFEHDENSNDVIRRGTKLIPNKTREFVIGIDPFDHDVTVDDRRSDGAAYVLRKHNAANETETFRFIVQYLYRPQTSKLFYEDMIKICHYFSCQMLFEDNKIGIKHYFEDRGYEHFLMWLPGANKPGISGSVKTHQQIAEYTEDYIENHIRKVPFKELVKDWLNFDINKTTKFDAAMAAGYTLIADSVKILKQKQVVNDVSELFRKRKIKL
jgi:hypothetical protein